MRLRERMGEKFTCNPRAAEISDAPNPKLKLRHAKTQHFGNARRIFNSRYGVIRKGNGNKADGIPHTCSFSQILRKWLAKQPSRRLPPKRNRPVEVVPPKWLRGRGKKIKKRVKGWVKNEILGFRSSPTARLISKGVRKSQAARRWGRKAEVFRHLLPHRDQRWLGGPAPHPDSGRFCVFLPKISGDGPEIPLRAPRKLPAALGTS